MVQQLDDDSVDVRAQNNRRDAERRGNERRGVLRWDPQNKERRAGKDRRKTPAEKRRDR